MFNLYKVSKNKYYVIHTLSGAKHSDKALSYHAARAQLRALNAIYDGNHLHPLDVLGGSFYDTIKSATKNIYGRVRGFITGQRFDYQPAIRKLLDEIKDINVIGITIYREPIKQAVNILANIVSLGEIDKYKDKYNIDDMFHLYAIATLSNNTYIRFEKNAEIDIQRVNNLPNLEDKYKFVCKMPNTNTSLPTMLTKTLNTIGQDRFFKYDALNNNCQSFIYNVLSTNNYNRLNPTMKTFVIQDLSELVKSINPTSQKVMNTITDLGKRAQILIGGAGLNAGSGIPRDA